MGLFALLVYQLDGPLLQTAIHYKNKFHQRNAAEYLFVEIFLV